MKPNSELVGVEHSSPENVSNPRGGESDEQSFSVVAVGASAGGLPALEEFFANLPLDVRAAFVVIQHLSPDFESKMDQLLGRQTDLPIVTVEDGVTVEPGKIYLSPPNSDMMMRAGRIFLTERDRSDVFRLPIDHFFRSMAQDVGPRCIGVVLSGTGSDGSRGVGEIHQVGGLVAAQSRETARFDGMPHSAAETGVVDLILRPSEIAEALSDYIGQFTDGSPFFEEPKVGESAVEMIVALLKQHGKVDFSDYKQTTVGRRIWRRVALGRHGGLENYLRILQTNPEELENLYRDLLIGVTRFFRDVESFEFLRSEVIPDMVRNAGSEGIRIWTPACSTGEEVYSIGMLILEEMANQNREVLPVKLFATDVDEVALRVANSALYPKEALLELSEARREKFFRPDSSGNFRVATFLREKVVFARHDVLNDPPFTSLDLVSCRNLLIYLRPPAQDKALTLFHFGLKRDGILFLGSSETPTASIADEFAKVSTKHRLFRKRRNVRLAPNPQRYLDRAPRAPRPERPVRSMSDSRLLAVYESLIGRHVPPSLLVDESYRVVHAFAGAEEIVRFPGGRMSTNILELVHPDLKMAIAGALRHAAQDGEDACYSGVRVAGEHDGLYEVSAQPVTVARDTHFLVTVERMNREMEARPDIERDDDVSQEYIDSIESELRYTRQNLQATVEELETSTEELQATNEELVASNEELQSTNEELHSVNEELYTVNSEYQQKIDELTQVTEDLDNLFGSIDIGVVFLDADLRIRKFTPQMADAFNLLPRDVGRRLDNFAHKIQHTNILADIEEVRESDEPIQKEVTDEEGNQHFLRVLPYRAETGETTGVLITLIDINALKKAEADASRLSDIVEQSHDAIVALNLEGQVLSWNQGASNLYGVEEEEALGESFWDVVAPLESRATQRIIELAKQGQRSIDVEAAFTRPDGRQVVASQSVSPLSDSDGELIGIATIARDITERRLAREAVERSVEHRDLFLAILSHELRNPLMALMTASRLFLDDNSPESDRTQAAEVVRRQTVHMARLLDDLLDVSRMRRDKIEMRREVIDLRDTVSDVLDEVSERATAAGIDFQVKVSDHPIPVLADRTRLKQVEANLLTNAFKHTPAGGRVVFTVDVDDGEAFVRVEDNGDGIAPELIEQIFDPFVQGEEPSDNKDGTGLGLGLALVDSIVRAHEGQVTATSDGPGKGSVFEVRFPIKAGRQISREIDMSVVDDGANDERHHRVLLVEDQDDNREILELALRTYGLDVSSVRTGTEALREIEEGDYTVGLVDIGLPDMSGLDVARKARQNGGAELLLLAVTGHGRQKDREEIMGAGFDLHLVKPVDVAQLVDAIRDGGRYTKAES